MRRGRARFCCCGGGWMSFLACLLPSLLFTALPVLTEGTCQSLPHRNCLLLAATQCRLHAVACHRCRYEELLGQACVCCRCLLLLLVGRCKCLSAAAMAAMTLAWPFAAMLAGLTNVKCLPCTAVTMLTVSPWRGQGRHSTMQCTCRVNTWMYEFIPSRLDAAASAQIADAESQLLFTGCSHDLRCQSPPSSAPQVLIFSTLQASAHLVCRLLVPQRCIIQR